MINLALSLERGAQVHPGKPAVHFADRTLTYAELNAAANRVANGLRALGIGKGDNVALACPNVPYFPIVYYGILKAGATVVPLSVLCKAPEFAYHLEDSQARAFFCFEGSAELPLGKEGHAGFAQWGRCPLFFMITADPAKPSPIEGTQTLAAFMQPQPADGTCADTGADDTAVILYTSGTTGRPKGAELTHANLAMNAFNSCAITRMDGTDCQLVALPLFHSFGQSVQMNAVLWCGAAMVLMPRFDPDAALAAMQRHGVTVFAGVPTMYMAILHLAGAEERHDLKAIAAKLRVGVSGGAAMPVEVMRRFEERFGIAILEGYGLSETSPVATFSFLEFPRIPGSVGKAIPGTQVRIVDDTGAPLPPGQPGEVVIRGHNVMKGYYRRPAETAAAIRDGWFHTGDIGKMDEDANFYIVDRLKDMVIRGGFNVYPRELEEVMMTHEAIAMVAVIGVPHETHGEEVKAVVVLRPGHAGQPGGDHLVVQGAHGGLQVPAHRGDRRVAADDRDGQDPQARAEGNMTRPTAIVAEDEPILRQQLEAKLGKIWPELEIIAAVEDGAAALEALEDRAPDFMFLDIQMPEMTGVEVARHVGNRAHVVFVTAYDQYAIQAFETGAVDYLLKPYTDERLAVTVERLKAKLASPPPDLKGIVAQLATQLRGGAAKERLQWIKASFGQNLRLIPVAEVLFFQSDEKYTRVVTAESEALIKTSIRELLDGLDPDVFWQVHRSAIVNVNAIAAVTRDFRGQAHIKVKGKDETLTVSRIYSHLFKQM